MELKDVIFLSDLPTLDLHGFDRDYARIKTLEFINDNIKMKNEIVCIIHGIGSGMLKKEVHKVLSENKNVLDFSLFYNNTGCTIAKILVKR